MLEAFPAEERASMRVRHHLFIRERDAGHAYDMTDAEASAAFPWLQEYWTTFGPFFARPPGGESLAQVCERVHSFLQKLGRSLSGRRVLVVTHAGTLWCFRYVLEGWTYEEAEQRFRTEAIRNCSVTAYERDDEGRLRLRGNARVYWGSSQEEPVDWSAQCGSWASTSRQRSPPGPETSTSRCWATR